MSTASRLAILSVLACGSDVPAIPAPCGAGVVGDAAQPARLLLLGVDGAVPLGIAGGTRIDVADGATVDLVRPPQGGHIVLLGARVENMNPCGVLLTATFRDAASGHIVAMDSRHVNLLPEGAFAASDVQRYSSFANVHLCPAYTAIRVEGGTFLATVEAVDAQGRTATATLTLQPVCRQAEATALALCACECAGNYRLGSCGATAPP